MANLDLTIVVIGLPTILQQLHATIYHGIWIITGYTLMMTILLVLLDGWLIYTAGCGFTIWVLPFLPSVRCFCALSRNGAELIAFRFLQGAGAALLYANSGAIITDAFPRTNSAWAWASMSWR